MEQESEDRDNRKIATARSSALKFMSAYPCCVRVVPYVNEIKEGQEKYLKMRVYIHTGGDEIPKDVKKAAEEMFTDYEIDYCDLQRLPLNKIVTQLPSSEKKREKELSKLSKIIEENLHVFENKLNVTAVQASYKVTGAKEKDELCVTVFVLGKGQIPAGETSFKKIEKLHNYPYDIAEGYYQPACLPVLGSYAHQLHSGVGIGVKDDEGAGTLGGFLTDENGKYYILSCKHVLHPPRMKSEEEDYAIVQPAESDYYKKIEEAEESLANLSQIEFTQEELDAMDAEERQYWETKEKNYKSKVDDLERIRSEKPRQIATYKCGVKDNVEVNLGESKVKVFVDAAIAELDDRERRFIERNSKVNRLCGFTEQYFKNSPNGEIVEVADFETERRKEETEHKKKLTFMKVGRTTGLQVSGEIYCDHNPMYINIQPADSPLSDFRSFNCDNCPQTDSSEEETFKKDNNTLTSCASCDVTFKSGDKITSFWIRNCLAIRQRKIPFCDKGDSGALVFDSNGRAWGQVVGVFEDLSRDFVFCQASPLSVTLKALESKSGKELKLWSTNKK